MVPTPIATPARTRLVIPKATTRRARWAAVTAMGALLLLGDAVPPRSPRMVAPTDLGRPPHLTPSRFQIPLSGTTSRGS